MKTLAALDDWGAALGASLLSDKGGSSRSRSSGAYLIPALLHMRFSAQLGHILAQSTFALPPLSGRMDPTPRIAIVLERSLDQSTEPGACTDESKGQSTSPENALFPAASEQEASSPAYLGWKLHAIRRPSQTSSEGWYPTEAQALQAVALTAEVPTEEAITSAEDFWDGFDSDLETDRPDRTPMALESRNGAEDLNEQDHDDDYWDKYGAVETAAVGDVESGGAGDGDASFLPKSPASPLPVPIPDPSRSQPAKTFLNLWSGSEAGSLDPPSSHLQPAMHRTGSVTTFLSTSPRGREHQKEHVRDRERQKEREHHEERERRPSKHTAHSSVEGSQVAALQSVLRGAWGMFRMSGSRRDLDHRRRLFLETAQGILKEP